MISSEVKRTLVKSPPELWAELSDEQALSRHLSGLGEIRIVKTTLEQSVEWEAEDAKGTVELKPSGWGTKVTLTVTRELEAEAIGIASVSGQRGETDAKPAGAEAEMESALGHENRSLGDEASASAEAEGPAEARAQADALTPAEADATAEPDVPAEADATAKAQGSAAAPLETEPRRPRLFARLWRRLKGGGMPTVQGEAATPAGDEAVEPEQEAAKAAEAPEAEMKTAEAPEPEAPEAPEPEAPEAPEADTIADAERSASTADLASELKAAEEAISAQTTELLTEVLDRLGAAHHRPFSRS